MPMAPLTTLTLFPALAALVYGPSISVDDAATIIASSIVKAEGKGQQLAHSVEQALLLYPGAAACSFDDFTEWPWAPPLLHASQSGNWELTNVLLNFKFDVYQATAHKETAFYVACREGHMSIVERLLEMKAADFPRCTTTDNINPLMAASERGHADVVRFLLAASFNDLGVYLRTAIHARDNKRGMSALQMACLGNHLEVIKMLLYANGGAPSLEETVRLPPSTAKGIDGAPPAEFLGYTALELLVAANATESLQYILSTYYQDQGSKHINKLLHTAIVHRRPQMLSLLLKSQGQGSKGGIIASVNVASPLILAASLLSDKNEKDNHDENDDKVLLSMMHSLLQQDFQSVHVQDTQLGWDALQYAAWKGHTAAIEMLLLAGASPTAKVGSPSRQGEEEGLSFEGWTAQSLSAVRGHLEALRVLCAGDEIDLTLDAWLALGRQGGSSNDKEWKRRREMGFWLLRAASATNSNSSNEHTHLEMARLLLLLTGPVDSTTTGGGGGAGAALKAAASINSALLPCSKDERPPLILACEQAHGQLEAIKFLIDVGAQPRGAGLLACAVEHGHVKLVEYLLSLPVALPRDCAERRRLRELAEEVNEDEVLEVLLEEDEENAARLGGEIQPCYLQEEEKEEEEVVVEEEEEEQEEEKVEEEPVVEESVSEVVVEQGGDQVMVEKEAEEKEEEEEEEVIEVLQQEEEEEEEEVEKEESAQSQYHRDIQREERIVWVLILLFGLAVPSFLLLVYPGKPEPPAPSRARERRRSLSPVMEEDEEEEGEEEEEEEEAEAEATPLLPEPPQIVSTPSLPPPPPATPKKEEDEIPEFAPDAAQTPPPSTSTTPSPSGEMKEERKRSPSEAADWTSQMLFRGPRAYMKKTMTLSPHAHTHTHTHTHTSASPAAGAVAPTSDEKGEEEEGEERKRSFSGSDTSAKGVAGDGEEVVGRTLKMEEGNEMPSGGVEAGVVIGAAPEKQQERQQESEKEKEEEGEGEEGEEEELLFGSGGEKGAIATTESTLD